MGRWHSPVQIVSEGFSILKTGILGIIAIRLLTCPFAIVSSIHGRSPGVVCFVVQCQHDHGLHGPWPVQRANAPATGLFFAT